MKVIITMAGGGTRFQRVGFTLPKFMLEARGRSLLSWSMESLRNFFEYEFLFVALKDHQASRFISGETERMGIKSYKVIELERITSGQAETVLAAEAALGKNDPILIYNIDTYVEPQWLTPRMIRGDGWVPVFECEGDHFSFVEFDSSFKVTAAAEKKRISPYGTVGLYYFSTVSTFKAALMRCSFKGLKEKFVAPLYAELISANQPVYTSLIPPAAVHVLGTPEEVRQFDPAFSF